MLPIPQRWEYGVLSWIYRSFRHPKVPGLRALLQFEEFAELDHALSRPLVSDCPVARSNIWIRSFCHRASVLLRNIPSLCISLLLKDSLKMFQSHIKQYLFATF